MWRALQDLGTAPSGMDFIELEAKAIRQWEAIEERRATWWSEPFRPANHGGNAAMTWIRDRALTLALMAMFLLFLVGQLVTGLAEYSSEQVQHGQHRRQDV